jgi:hypothetical protein
MNGDKRIIVGLIAMFPHLCMILACVLRWPGPWAGHSDLSRMHALDFIIPLGFLAVALVVNVILTVVAVRKASLLIAVLGMALMWMGYYISALLYAFSSLEGQWASS